MLTPGRISGSRQAPHASRSFIYKQVLAEAPWIDVIVRGEGGAVTLNLVRAIDEGRWPNERDQAKSIAFLGDDGAVVATPAEPSIKDIGSWPEMLTSPR